MPVKEIKHVEFDIGLTSEDLRSIIEDNAMIKFPVTPVVTVNVYRE